MKQYKIESITHLDGTPRTDGRYPQRVGSTVKLSQLFIGSPIIYGYISDSDGNPKDGWLRTSRITSIECDESEVTVTTMNSIYKFVAVGK